MSMVFLKRDKKHREEFRVTSVVDRDINIIQRIYGVLTNPYGAFSEMTESRPIGQALTILFLTSILNMLLAKIVLSGRNIFVIYEITIALIFILIVNILVVHLFIKMLNGKEDIIITTCVVSFSFSAIATGVLIILLFLLLDVRSTVVHFLSSYLVFCSVCYYAILIVSGLSETHKIQSFTAFIGGIVGPAALFWIIGVLI